MGQFKTFSFFLLCAFNFLLLTSCGDDKSVVESKISDEVIQINELAREVETQTIDGTILSSSTQADKNRILSAVRNAKTAILALSQNTKNKNFLYSLFTSIKEYQATDKIVKDEFKLDRFFNKATLIAKKYAAKMGVDLEDLDWKQFEYNFSSGISPFGVYSDVISWTTDWQQDAPLALVKGTGTSSWLISPEFDLTNATNASFEFSHMFGADANARETVIEFNRAKFIKDVFKVKVSTDYQGGDPSAAKWTELKLDVLPTGVDFHKVKSGRINLSRFAGLKATIAFHYNANSKIAGKHYLNWNIYDFKLHANESIGEIIKRPGPILTDKFSANLGDFQSLSLNIDSSKWSYGSGGGKEFAVINSNGSNSTTWLISPKYDLSKVTTAQVLIKQIAKNVDLDKIRLWISDSYDGGDPSTSNWKPVLQKFADGAKIPDAWTDLMAGPFELQDYLGKSVVFGFEFIQTTTDASTWEIVNIDFVGEGSEIKKSKVNLTFEQPEPPKDETKELLSELNLADEFAKLSYSVVSGTPSDFFVNAKGEAKSVRISGFKNKSNGVARLTSPVITTNGKNGILLTLDHSINFAKDINPRDLIKIFVQDANDASKIFEVVFENFPVGNSFNTISSGPFALPVELDGLDFKVIFEYKSFDPHFVTWDLYKLSVFVQK